MGGLESDEEMHMVGNTSDPLSEGPQTFDSSAKVLVESVLPMWLNEGVSIFC